MAWDVPPGAIGEAIAPNIIAIGEAIALNIIAIGETIAPNIIAIIDCSFLDFSANAPHLIASSYADLSVTARCVVLTIMLCMLAASLNNRHRAQNKPKSLPESAARTVILKKDRACGMLMSERVPPDMKKKTTLDTAATLMRNPLLAHPHADR